MLYPDQKPVLKVPGSDEDFSVAKYKQELAKPYSKVDLYICKETEFKKDRETDDMSDRRAEKKPCKDDLIDIPSDDDLMFDNPVFESPAKPAIDGNQIPPAASCGGSSVKQHGRAISTSTHQENLAAKDGKKWNVQLAMATSLLMKLQYMQICAQKMPTDFHFWG